MCGFTKAALLGLLALSWLLNPQGPAHAQSASQTTQATPRAISPDASPNVPSEAATEPPKDAPSFGRTVLNAGPDPRVQLDGLSRDHAAIFGTEDENERALMDQERALQVQRDQLHMLERLLTGTPANTSPNPPAMIPLNSAAPTSMPRLAPTPSGSKLNQGGGDAQRSVDDMQHRVNALRRGAEGLRQTTP